MVIAQALALIDDEFVYSKGRTISLKDRYRLGPKDLHFIVADDKVVSVAAVKPYTFMGELGIRIGFVYTRPDYRNQGYASRLLREITENCKWAVLWTNIPKFYERLGWVAWDNSLLGEVDGLGQGTSHYWWNRQIPLPATCVDRFRNVIVGRNGDVGYVYQMPYPPNWEPVYKAYKKIWINESIGSPTSNWLMAYTKVKWHFQHQAMWLGNVRGYIPYLDRI